MMITMLPNGNIVEEVYDNIIDNFKPGTLLVDCSTIDVDKARELHKKCEIKNFYLLMLQFQEVLVEQNRQH